MTASVALALMPVLTACQSPRPAATRPDEVLSGSRLPHTNLLLFHTRSGEVHPVRSVKQWPERRQEILTRMQEVMGPLPGKEKRCPLDVQLVEEIDHGAYVFWSITYAAEPGDRVPAYVLIPKAALEKRTRVPGVLALHQTHRLGNKVVVGLGQSPHDEYGLELVRRGYVVLAPAYPLLAQYHPNLRALGYASGTMKAIWNNVRGLDLLESLPFVQRGRFAAIGHSLGGHNSIYTAVFDERIKAVVSSCGFDSYRDYMDGNIKGWTSERYMPRLLDYRVEEIPFDFHELIGALAPRACFVSAPLGDTNFKWRSVDAVTHAARPVYELFSAGDQLRVEHPDCGHLFPPHMREAAYQVIERALKRGRSSTHCSDHPSSEIRFAAPGRPSSAALAGGHFMETLLPGKVLRGARELPGPLVAAKPTGVPAERRVKTEPGSDGVPKPDTHAITRM